MSTSTLILGVLTTCESSGDPVAFIFLLLLGVNDESADYYFD